MLRLKSYTTHTLFFLVALFSACEKFEPAAPAEEDLLDGPVEGLSYAENAQFLAGDIAFNDEVFTKEKGLGPIFVATSCGSCHAGDGKGTPFTTLTRFGQVDATGNKFLHLGGPQIQHRAIPGYRGEVIPAGATSAKFTPPANTGLGYLESIPDAELLRMTDPDDLNKDGISGEVNWIQVPAYLTIPDDAISRDGKYIGRFGKKAAAFTLLHQTVNAYNQDMGITSTFENKDVYTNNTIDPEVSDLTVRNVVAYLQMLKAPIQRNQDDPIVKQGKTLFAAANCSGCHIPQLQSGQSPIDAISNKTFYPYTDMLLHDMGAALDDKYTEGTAKTYEWRTPPLWGLGLSPGSQGGKYYLMHDGRAKSIHEAIILHGGEADKSKNKYVSMTDSEKSALIKFLESL